MAKYEEVLQETPLSEASAKQLEKIKQIDEDLETLMMGMKDEEYT